MFAQGCFIFKTRFLRGGWERHFRESFPKTIKAEVHLSASLVTHLTKDMGHTSSRQLEQLLALQFVCAHSDVVR